MSSQEHELEIPETTLGHDVTPATMSLEVRGHTITMRADDTDAGMVWLKVEVDEDQELNVTPADLGAVEDWVRKFLELRREGR